MPANERDDSREERIDLEIVVDAYNKEERAMGWYYYLDNHLNFPFKALWTSRRRTSSLTSETVEVVGMSHKRTRGQGEGRTCGKPHT